MPVSEPHVQALYPDAKEAACFGRNHQQLGEVDGPKPWLERLKNEQESRGDVVQIGGEEYRIGKRLGKGSFGVVFEGDKLSEEGPLPVAIKFEPRRSDNPQLRDEYRVYRTLSGGGQELMDGIPKVHSFSPFGFHNVLIIDLLGYPLEDLFQERKRKFTLKTVALLAKRTLYVVELVHAEGIIHRDLKPQNFLMGRPGTPAANKVHLIDFGMAKHYRDLKTQKHIPYREKQPLLGTARYMSINTHLGREQSRRDDLEALCHVWLYFLRGSLPWQGTKASKNKKKHTRIGEKKQQATIDDLCAGFPEEFAKCLRYIRGLGFEDQPDYDHGVERCWRG
ncbi:kinase-like domain-containing protein [Apiosordaria backusii]|uniref:non-specific serine/threonine protein kinase n=1 Tax=Apiosordaria backusii TaxID=314023 RepID=A0AA40ESW2_9PEZI|nr:kinase-like domain-containing protein [Apiosordaria backusii]